MVEKLKLFLVQFLSQEISNKELEYADLCYLVLIYYVNLPHMDEFRALWEWPACLRSAPGLETNWHILLSRLIHIMGVEITENKLPVEAAGNETSIPEVENVNITFGSHGVNEPFEGELNKHTESNLPKDAVDEWPEPSQIHSFYIVRYRAFEDRNLKAKLDVAEKELQKKNQARIQIFEKLKTKRVSYGQFSKDW